MSDQKGEKRNVPAGLEDMLMERDMAWRMECLGKILNAAGHLENMYRLIKKYPSTNFAKESVQFLKDLSTATRDVIPEEDDVELIDLQKRVKGSAQVWGEVKKIINDRWKLLQEEANKLPDGPEDLGNFPPNLDFRFGR